jgi:hypothetical protein
MKLYVESSFDILLIIDKNFQFQQNLDKYPITIIVFDSFSSKIEELILFLPAFRTQLPLFEKNKAYLINKEAPE